VGDGDEVFALEAFGGRGDGAAGVAAAREESGGARGNDARREQ
jgi:hypothetical protein